MTVQRKRAGVSEAFQNWCAVFGSTVTDSPAAATMTAPSTLNVSEPSSHLEDLGLVRVQVGARHEPVGLDEDVDRDALAVGVGRGLDEADRLAGDAVVDHVSGADHLCVAPRCR